MEEDVEPRPLTQCCRQPLCGTCRIAISVSFMSCPYCRTFDFQQDEPEEQGDDSDYEDDYLSDDSDYEDEPEDALGIELWRDEPPACIFKLIATTLFKEFVKVMKVVVKMVTN